LSYSPKNPRRSLVNYCFCFLKICLVAGLFSNSQFMLYRQPWWA